MSLPANAGKNVTIPVSLDPVPFRVPMEPYSAPEPEAVQQTALETRSKIESGSVPPELGFASAPENAGGLAMKKTKTGKNLCKMVKFVPVEQLFAFLPESVVPIATKYKSQMWNKSGMQHLAKMG